MKSSQLHFQVRFWGVRGSYPTSVGETLKFGGHTACVEVNVGGHRLIFDAGTGIIPLGKALIKNQQAKLRLNLFLSHTHHDHLIGFYFFEPLLRKRTQLFIFGPSGNGHSLRKILSTAMNRQLFPIGFHDLKAQKKIYSLQGGETIRLEAGEVEPKVEKNKSFLKPGSREVVIWTFKSNDHPRDGVMLYRVNYGGKSLVYATDIEQKENGDPAVIEFAHKADLLIHDAQYLNSEYNSRTDAKKGWGHSTVERAVSVAKRAEVRRLVLFHHEPTHDDNTMEKIERKARKLFPATFAAYEGLTLHL